MTQRDRDRLVVLKKAHKKLIRQREAAEELGVTIRHVKRLVRRLRKQGDRVVIHGLRGRPSPRRVSEEQREKAIRILSQEIYQGFGPTLASEYLAKRHKIRIGRETLRQILMGAGLWRSRRQKVKAVRQWRQRRSCRGEMVQWDTSEHDWLEGRGEKLYLIHMIDDASSELTARFVRHDSSEENMRVLWSYLERNGRPVEFYTDKASLFRTPQKRRRDQPGEETDAVEMPPTQIGRALRELGIAWSGAHSPQAKGRVERSFSTAQDRLVKGLRVAGAKTLEDANRYLEQHYLPWWNQHLTVAPAHATDAHRSLGKEHELGAILSVVDTRTVTNDYTLRFQGRMYQIAKEDVRAGLRGSHVRIEMRLDSSLRVRFGERYVGIQECHPRPKPTPPPAPSKPRAPGKSRPPNEAWRRTQSGIARSGGIPVWRAAEIDRTRTVDRLD
jgi:transposase